MRMNRWTRNGMLDRVFACLQAKGIVHIRLEVVGLDSTIVPVHPDGTGARKKWTAGHRTLPRRLDHQASSGCRGRADCASRSPVPRPGQGRFPTGGNSCGRRGPWRTTSGCRTGRPW